jgi:GNAT superfamily N-acetyltransferase
MNVHALTAAPGPELAAALARFEEQFAYPLGPGRSFRVSHGGDYPRFFRAVGAAVCFVAERGGAVLGVLGMAATRVVTADGPDVPAIYLGDLKVAPAARGGRVLTRMADAAAEWCHGRAACGFGVVMDGTPVTPDRYTGRLGIPPFREAATVAVLRLPAAGSTARANWPADAATGVECFARLAAGRVHTGGGNPAERSETLPLWLVAPDGSACGRFEDTRRAKRLIANDGEMIAAHLSCIGYANHAALAELFRVACGLAAARGFPALFAAVPADEANVALAHLDEPGVVVAPATVFASGFEPGHRWSINTAEI